MANATKLAMCGVICAVSPVLAGERATLDGGLKLDIDIYNYSGVSLEILSRAERETPEFSHAPVLQRYGGTARLTRGWNHACVHRIRQQG
jgi:hypothetical protein